MIILNSIKQSKIGGWNLVTGVPNAVSMFRKTTTTISTEQFGVRLALKIADSGIER
jgi:hypothetical protein